MRHSEINATSLVVMVASLLRLVDMRSDSWPVSGGAIRRNRRRRLHWRRLTKGCSSFLTCLMTGLLLPTALHQGGVVWRHQAVELGELLRSDRGARGMCVSAY